MVIIQIIEQGRIIYSTSWCLRAGDRRGELTRGVEADVRDPRYVCDGRKLHSSARCLHEMVTRDEYACSFIRALSGLLSPAWVA